MRWTAVVPLKPGGERKSRLIGLSPAERADLAQCMAVHVVGLVAMRVERCLLLAERAAFGIEWAPDLGAGLNAELGRLRTSIGGALLVIHADLPFLAADDLAVLLAAAETCGSAIAPDRTGQGTNALALTGGREFAFAFGAQSCARHRALLPAAAVVSRDGLAFDIDTPGDLADARARSGRDWRWPHLHLPAHSHLPVPKT